MADAQTFEGLRAYFKRLRLARGVTQEELAGAMKLSRRAYIDWETGETKELKAGPLIRAVSFLKASLTQVQHLIDSGADAEEGQRLAEAWLTDVKTALAGESEEYVTELTLEVLNERLRRLEERLDQ